MTIERLTTDINRAIVRSPFPEDPFHALNTVEWVLRLDPAADDSLQTAALGHDIERAFEDRRIRPDTYATYDEYKAAHAANSAVILTELMREAGLDPDIIDDIAGLVAAHETGGEPRSDLLRDADILSFFTVSLPLYYDRHGPATTRRRCVWGYKRLTPALRWEIAGIEFPDPALQELVREALGV